MRSWLSLFCLSACLTLCVGQSAFGSPLFSAFIEQRELVASIPFDQDAMELNASLADELAACLKEIREVDGADRMIRIEGFPGREGALEDSFRMSLNRANAVARYLEEKGISCVVGITEEGFQRNGEAAADVSPRVEIATYPKLLMLEYNDSLRIDLDEVK